MGHEWGFSLLRVFSALTVSALYFLRSLVLRQAKLAADTCCVEQLQSDSLANRCPLSKEHHGPQLVPHHIASRSHARRS
jgi:hypothetical protein